MGKATATLLEMRFIIEPELTQAYYLYWGRGDCPIGVTGWHHKTFPASKPVIDILTDEDDSLLWPLEAPP